LSWAHGEPHIEIGKIVALALGCAGHLPRRIL
jgi:hypothetical protein